MAHRSNRRSSYLLLLALTLGGLGLQTTSAQTGAGAEYQVKAAFIYNFIRFVEWPAARFYSHDAPYVVCVAGDNPFGSELQDVLAGRTVRNRTIETRTFDIDDSRTSACHVAFVGAPDRAIVDATVANSHPGVLTVGEGQAFSDAGGIIALTVSDRKVRFAINPSRAEMAGLRISSQLLSLAEIVEDTSNRSDSSGQAR